MLHYAYGLINRYNNVTSNQRNVQTSTNDSFYRAFKMQNALMESSSSFLPICAKRFRFIISTSSITKADSLTTNNDITFYTTANWQKLLIWT